MLATINTMLQPLDSWIKPEPRDKPFVIPQVPVSLVATHTLQTTESRQTAVMVPLNHSAEV
jgi:hypothetical protein